MFDITKTIYSNSERSEQFLKQNVFYSWRLIRPNELKQLGFKLEKNNWDIEGCMKSWKNMLLTTENKTPLESVPSPCLVSSLNHMKSKGRPLPLSSLKASFRD